MIETIEYKGKIYPKFQSQGFGSQFAIPYDKQLYMYVKGLVLI